MENKGHCVECNKKLIYGNDTWGFKSPISAEGGYMETLLPGNETVYYYHFCSKECGDSFANKLHRQEVPMKDTGTNES